MASLTLSGSTLVVSGLTSGYRYAFRVYYTTPSSSGDWRYPTSDTVVATSSSCNLSISISMTAAGSYSFYVNVWDGTNNTNTTTNTVRKTVDSGGTTSRTHYARTGDGVSYFYLGGNYINSTSAKSFTATTNTLTVSNIGLQSGYTTPYLLYYNVSASPTLWDYGYNSFSTSTTSIDATFSRRITLKATKSVTYYKYTQNVYVDNSFVTTATNSVNTSSTVRISALPAYSNYVGNYNFSYATANSRTYSASDYVSLSSSSTTIINLYFTTKQSTTTYPYRQLIFIDGSQVTSADNTTNTSSSVQVSTLSGYTRYKSDYDFQYATANNKNYAPSGSITLTADSMTYIYLYFTTKQSTTTYPYRQYVYVDDSLIATTDNTVNTSSSVQVSSLAGYTNNKNKYTFQYATANGKNYAASAYITLTADSMTYISLYFKSTGTGNTKYPYRQYVYVDNSLLTTTDNTVNTDSSVQISSLAGYTNYIDSYDFQKVIYNSTQYSSNATIRLQADTMSYIHIYFTTKTSGNFPYTQYIYLDGSLLTTVSNTTNTSGSISAYDLSGYTQYSTKYTFSHFEISGQVFSTNNTITFTRNKMMYISLYFLSTAETPIQPVLSVLSVQGTTVTLGIDKKGATAGVWVLIGQPEGNIIQIFTRTTDDTIILKDLLENTKYTVFLRHEIGSDYEQSRSISFTTGSKVQIAYFSWTSNDAANIKAGNDFSSFITATGWNNLCAKINECRTAKGQSKVSFSQVQSGQTLTAETYNNIKDYILSLTTAGTVAADVSKGSPAYATLFANSDSALKEAINRVIATLNS